MTALRLLARLGLARPTDSGICGCSHPASAHLHFRPGSDCGPCGLRRCDRYEPISVADACRDDEVIDAVRAGDIDHALALAPAPLVTVLQALAESGRRP